MEFQAKPVAPNEIALFRPLFLQENNFQIRYNACHERGWSDLWMLSIDGVAVGYGAVKGQTNTSDRDTIFEAYIIPAYRKYASQLFSILLQQTGAEFIECQSNDMLLTSLLYEFASGITSDVLLFRDQIATNICVPNVIFRRLDPTDVVFNHYIEPTGEYVVAEAGIILATGGFMLHYNYPFADLYMEVREDKRRSGYGSFLIQEVKKECYLHGRVPAARCSSDNIGSKSCLIKAGMCISGSMLKGRVKK